MSKIYLPIAELKPALVGLGKIISRASTLPVLQNIKVERTKDGWITLTSTDLDIFITVRLEQPAEGAPLSMLVSYETLQHITKRCGKTDAISVEADEDNRILVEYPIGTQTGQEHIKSLAVDEYPPIPKVKAEAVPIKDDLRLAMLEAFECASVDEMVVSGFSMMALVLPSRRPEPTVDVSLGKFLLTMCLCGCPFLLLIVFTDPPQARKQFLILLLLVSITVVPLLIHRKKIHTPPASESEDA